MKEPQDVPFEKEGQYLKSDNRSNISYFLEHNVLLRRFTLSVEPQTIIRPGNGEGFISIRE